MRVHHLNCGTMCPAAGRLINDRARVPSRFGRGLMVCHCLLIETDRDGLILIDTGIGARDVADPGRLPRGFRAIVGTRLDPAETALAQVRGLGFAVADVRHLVITHLDLDHAGGLADFPDAQVHVHRREHAGAMRRTSRVDRGRYLPVQWQHGPRWSTYDERDGGDVWLEHPAVRALDGVRAEIALIPTPGHSHGHLAVAVRQPRGGADHWLLHAGDAYFFHGEMSEPPRCPPGLRLLQRFDDVDRAARLASQARLRSLARRPDVEVSSARTTPSSRSTLRESARPRGRLRLILWTRAGRMTPA